ncbi:MAG: archease [bacterium]|nr:archease [bacterium]
MKKFEIFEHTADIGIVAYGVDLKEVFNNAAYGMFSLITDLNKVTKDVKINVRVMGRNLSELLVTWLSELLYYHAVEDIFFVDFKIKTLNERSIQAIAYGEEYNPDRHEIMREIKIVTYHELKIEHENKRWKAQIIFDV